MNKRGLTGQEIFIMLATSSKKKQIPESQRVVFRGAQLKGVNADIDQFNEYRRILPKDNSVLIQSAKNHALETKDNILKKIQQFFGKVKNKVFFFYSGHGNELGDLIVQTIDSEAIRDEGEIISLYQMIELWQKVKGKKGKNNAHLYIILDSCYSGMWCNRVCQDSQRQKSISIVASCQYDEKAKDMSGGGLLFRTIMCPKQEFESYYELLLKHQHPKFVGKGEIMGDLKKKQLSMLNDSFNNIDKLEGNVISVNKRWWDPETYPANGHHQHTDGEGNVYNGEWKDYQRHGQGTMTYANGQVYTGGWKNHVKSGNGVLQQKDLETGANSGVFKGNFENGMANGYGEYKTVNNWIIKCNWKDWKQHGKGQIIMDGFTLKGRWQQDALVQQYE